MAAKSGPKSGGQKRTPKVTVKSGPQQWRQKVDPKSVGQKWTPKVAVKKGLQKGRSKVDPKSGGQKWTRKVGQPLQNCIGPTIRIGREILCLPYAGFLTYFLKLRKIIFYDMKS